MTELQTTLERIMAKAKSTGANSSSSQRIEPTCAICDDTGYIVEDYEARPCKCLEVRRAERLFKSSQITPAFRQKTFDNFYVKGKQAIIKKMADCGKNYVANFSELDGRWMALLGAPGSGKTHISMAVCNALIKQYIPVLYFQHVEGIKEFYSMFAQKEDIGGKVERMKTAPVLYWDDLYKPPKEPKDFEIELAFEVLNYRYINLLPTIISSELIPERLLEIDEATGSRIIERAKGHLVTVSGEGLNYRLEVSQ